MNSYASRAREIARRIHTGMVWVDANAAHEIAELLDTLAELVDAQSQNITSVEFALNYYGQPALYRGGIHEESILDGGLRARTALGLLKRAPRGQRFLHGEPS